HRRGEAGVALRGDAGAVERARHLRVGRQRVELVEELGQRRRRRGADAIERLADVLLGLARAALLELDLLLGVRGTRGQRAAAGTEEQGAAPGMTSLEDLRHGRPSPLVGVRSPTFTANFSEPDVNAEDICGAAVSACMQAGTSVWIEPKRACVRGNAAGNRAGP